MQIYSKACLRASILVACATMLMAGCKFAGITGTENANDRGPSAAVNSSAPSAATMPSMAPQPVRIVYRTKSDRLNLTGSGLPQCSMATLQVQVPHPHYEYKTDVAFGRLVVVPCSIDDEVAMGELPPGYEQAATVWEGDIPGWQVNAIVRELDDANFSRRAKVLGATSYLFLETGGERLGKPYRDVASLDAIVATLSQDVPRTGTANARPELSRLPAVDLR